MSRTAARAFHRAAFATANHALAPRGTSVEDVAKSLWSDDSVTGIILRAATSPATTTGATWASPLAQSAVGDFVSSLGALSAGAKLIDASMRVSLAGVNQITIPARVEAMTAGDVAWIVEAGPIPAATMTIGNAATLGPMRKLCAIIVMTRELMESSAAQTVFQTMLKESCAFSLDASLFSNAAATTARPAGILNGITPLSGAPGGDDTAVTSDLAKLAAAVGAVSPGLAFIGNPVQANIIKLRRGSTFPVDVPVWSSMAIPEGTLIALDPGAFVSAFGPEPELRSSIEVLVHTEDTTPAQIGTAGSPNVVAAPSRSTFQTDTVATRCVLRCAWTWRVPNAVAWIQDTSW